jgi:CelD/BcsL family acetyltransferase involved in cellulose biosynthesis
MQEVIKETIPPLSTAFQKLQSHSPLKAMMVTEDAGFDALKEEWDQLLDDSDQCVYFLRWSWNRLWWRYYAPAHSRLFIITYRNEHGRLVGVAPFYWRERRVGGITYLRELQFLGTGIGIKINEYMDIVARRGYERMVADMTADSLRRNDRWDRLWLWCIPASSTVLSHFQRAMGENTLVTVCDHAHYVDTSNDWESYIQGLGKSTRYNIKHRIRHLFKEHTCNLRLVETSEELESAMNDLVQLHQARWESKGESGSFKLPGFESFLKEAMRVSLAEGRLRLWMLTVDGRIAATLVAFVDRGVAHYFQGGFDPAYSEYRVGIVLLGLCIQRCFEAAELREFDFMGGGAKYKDRWTRTRRDMCDLQSFRPSVRSHLYMISSLAVRETARIFRAVAPAPVKALCRRLVASIRGPASDE